LYHLLHRFPDRFAQAIRTEAILVHPGNYANAREFGTPTRQTFAYIRGGLHGSAVKFFAAV